MGVKMIVSNAGPLIHLARISKLKLLRELFGEVVIPHAVREEVVERGKEKGKADAFLIEEGIKEGWIVTVEDIGMREIAESAGIEEAEAIVIAQAREKSCPVLLDDLAARRFAIGLGLEVVGSVGVLIKSTKEHGISKEEAFNALDKLAKVMWLSIDVYEGARNTIKEL
jgi:predicted nucleic acid-binding protein